MPSTKLSQKQNQVPIKLNFMQRAISFCSKLIPQAYPINRYLSYQLTTTIINSSTGLLQLIITDVYHSISDRPACIPFLNFFSQ